MAIFFGVATEFRSVARRRNIMQNVTQQQVEAVRINTEAFISLSRIAFASLERLAALSLNASRIVIESSVATTGSVLQATTTQEPQKVGLALPDTITRNAAAYMQEVQAIAVETQQEIAKLTTSYFSPHGEVAKPAEGWLKGFEVFQGFARQVTAMTEANSKAIGEVSARLADTAATLTKKRA
jgi:adenine deaminase